MAAPVCGSGGDGGAEHTGITDLTLTAIAGEWNPPAAKDLGAPACWYAAEACG